MQTQFTMFHWIKLLALLLAQNIVTTRRGNGVLIKTAKLLLDNDLSGKPEDIYLFLGQHPKAAFGNSNGDQQMLEYTQAGQGAHLMMLVHHDDAEREYAYAAKSKVGTFSDALMSEANKRV